MIHRQVLFPVYLLISIICFSGSAYILISGYSKLDIAAKLVFSDGLLIGIVLILFCFHYPVRLFCASKQTCRSFLLCSDGGRQINRNTNLRIRCWRSMRPTRIYFFQNNYFDRQTPFNLFQFSLKTAIKLTLIEK